MVELVIDERDDGWVVRRLHSLPDAGGYGLFDTRCEAECFIRRESAGDISVERAFVKTEKGLDEISLPGGA